jgi:DNA-binding HxlR family transcriptional regulator
MAKRYDQYCPVAHALDLVGERWSLLVVRELLHGPLRYTDIHARLQTCSTNVLAARLKDLEAAGVVQRRQLPPPAASTVYELTEAGHGLRRVLHELAWWGARTLGPPQAGDESAFETGWLQRALVTALEPIAPMGTIELRVDDEVAHLADGRAHHGPALDPDVVVSTDPAGFYHLLVDRDPSGCMVEGDGETLDRLLETLPAGPMPALP